MLSKKKNKIRIGINDLFPFMDGFDIAINFSILIFLSSFILQDLDSRVSILIMSSIILLSFASRIFDLNFLKILKKYKLSGVNIFLLFILIYFLPLLIQKNFPVVLSVFIFSLSRVLFGVIISLSYRNVNINQESFSIDISGISFWIFYSLGLAFGVLIYLFINELYSNNDLNDGAWKIFYLIKLIMIGIFYFIIKMIFKIKMHFKHDVIHDELRISAASGINCFIILIPLICFILFISSNWLPKFSNPENLYFLNFNFINFLLIIMMLAFIVPLASLVGKKRSIIFFNFSIISLSLLISLIGHDSSYSIDFLKFYLSIVSSFTICCFIFQLEVTKLKIFSIYNCINQSLLICSLIIPPLFYIFINYVINYSVIYIVISIVYLINYIFVMYKKNG